jgi:hypothetical protein
MVPGGWAHRIKNARRALHALRRQVGEFASGDFGENPEPLGKEPGTVCHEPWLPRNWKFKQIFFEGLSFPAR